MTLEQYEQKYMGCKIRDGQCVSLFRDVMEAVHDIPHTGSVRGAINLWTDFDSFPQMQKYFTRVYDKENVQRGDAVIFGTTETNSYGHVAIVTEVHEDGMECIEQDGFKLSGVKPAFWTWRRFVGALRARG